MSATTTHNLPYKRFVAQVSTGAPRPKSTYLSLMAENLEALKACPWREASDVPVALVDHDFTKASHFSDAYDAFKMTGAWNATDQTETAFAGMAAYRFKIPTAAASVAISSISLPISRDRFLKGGVHVAAVRSSSATPSTDWSTVTGAGASAYLANTAANIVATQPADGSLTIATPAGTGGYLWIYVTLEDYTDWWDKYSATEARQYAIEGSAMLVGGSAAVTFASAVAADSAATSFAVCRGGVLPYLAEADRTVRSYECLAAGGDLPEPRLVAKQVTATSAALYYGSYKIRDIEGDARGIRIFASNVLNPSVTYFSDLAGANDPYLSYSYAGTGSFEKAHHVRNVQFFAVLGVDGGKSDRAGNYLNQIAPNVMFFLRCDVRHTCPSTSGTRDEPGWISCICEVPLVHNYMDNLSTVDTDGSAHAITDEEREMVAQTYSGYLNANIAHRMLATRTAESITLVAGPGTTAGLNKIVASFNSSPGQSLPDGVTAISGVLRLTSPVGISCRVYVSGAEGVGFLGQFLNATYGTTGTATKYLRYNATIANIVRGNCEFYVEGGEGRVWSEKALYALYTKESFAYSAMFWYVAKRIIGYYYRYVTRADGTIERDVNGEPKIQITGYIWGLTWGASCQETSVSAETVVPFTADDGSGVLRVGEIGSVTYKGAVKGIVRYNLSPTSSALVYGEFEEVDGRRCSTYFVVTARSNSLYVWIPPNEALGRPDTFEQVTVTNLRNDPAKILISGAFSSVGGRTEDSSHNSIAGLCVFDMNTGAVATCAASHPSDIVSSFIDSSAAPSSDELRPCVYYDGTFATNDQSGNYVALFASGNHMRTFRAWTAAELPVATPSEEESCIGMRNAYAKLAEGRWTTVPVDASAQPGAAFAVRLATVPVPYTADGIAEGTQDVSMWHISATAALVPFSAPVGMRARAVKLEWSDLVCTTGAILNVWLKRGEYMSAMPIDTLRKPQIHDATQSEVDGWELVCSLPADTTGDVTVDIAPFSDYVGTFLLTAYLPQDAYNPESESESAVTSPIGVGTVDADALNGTVTNLGSGWKPDITLI